MLTTREVARLAGVSEAQRSCRHPSGQTRARPPRVGRSYVWQPGDVRIVREALAPSQPAAAPSA